MNRIEIAAAMFEVALVEHVLVVLTEERGVVEKVAEPVERVRLGTETVAEEKTDSGEVVKNGTTAGNA